MTEADYQRRIIDCAQRNGWLVFHPRPARVGGRIITAFDGHKGFPDLVLARGGVVLLAEIKLDHSYPEPEQRAWRDAIGAQWRLWRPRDWPQVMVELARTAGQTA